MDEIITRIGVADCHGIESYFPEPAEPVSDEEKTNFWKMQLRATSNRQRHAVVYRATLTPDKDEMVKAALKLGDWAMALSLLKVHAMRVSFPECSTKSYEKSWRLIPNPDLDPWS